MIMLATAITTATTTMTRRTMIIIRVFYEACSECCT